MHLDCRGRGQRRRRCVCGMRRPDQAPGKPALQRGIKLPHRAFERQWRRNASIARARELRPHNGPRSLSFELSD